MSELSYKEKLSIVSKLILQEYALLSVEPFVNRVSGGTFIIFEKQKQEFVNSKTMIFSLAELDLLKNFHGTRLTKNVIYDTLNKLRDEQIIDYRLTEGSVNRNKKTYRTTNIIIEIPCELIQTKTLSKEKAIDGTATASVGIISRIMANNDLPSKECAVRLELDSKHNDLYMYFVETAHKKKLKHFNYDSIALKMFNWLLSPDVVGKQVDISDKKKQFKYTKNARGLGQQIIPDEFSEWRDLFIEATGDSIRLYKDVTHGRLNTFGFEIEKMEKEVFNAKR